MQTDLLVWEVRDERGDEGWVVRKGDGGLSRPFRPFKGKMWWELKWPRHGGSKWSCLIIFSHLYILNKPVFTVAN